MWVKTKELTAGTLITNPVTCKKMIVVGYDDGTLEFRDWQGSLLATRGGFGEITALDAYRCSGSPLPRLFVASTDSGGAVRVMKVDADTLFTILSDLAVRFGFGKIAAMDIVDDAYFVDTVFVVVMVLWQNASAVCDRSDSPWDDQFRRPSHADKRSRLRQEVLKRTFFETFGHSRKNRKIAWHFYKLLKLAA